MKNVDLWLMEGLQQIFEGLADPKVAAQEFIVRFGVPDGI